MIEQRNFNFSVLLQKARSNEAKITNTDVTRSILPEKILIPEREISYEELIVFGIDNEDLIVNRMNKPRLRERSIWSLSSCVSVIESKVIDRKDEPLNFKTIKTCNEKSNQMNLDSTNNAVENNTQEISLSLSGLKNTDNYVEDNPQEINLFSSSLKNTDNNVKDVSQRITLTLFDLASTENNVRYKTQENTLILSNVKISNKNKKRSRLRYCNQRKKIKMEIQKKIINLHDLTFNQMENNLRRNYENLDK